MYISNFIDLREIDEHPEVDEFEDALPARGGRKGEEAAGPRFIDDDHFAGKNFPLEFGLD